MTTEIKLAPGQVWTYNNRPIDSDSKLTILRIDERDKRIVHIAVDRIVVQGSSDADQTHQSHTEISHMPFSYESVLRSLRNFVGLGELPEYEDGYSIWEEAFNRGEAGVYSITVGEAVQLMDETVQDD